MGAYKLSIGWFPFIGVGVELRRHSWSLKMMGLAVTYRSHGTGYWLFGKYLQGGK